MVWMSDDEYEVMGSRYGDSDEYDEEKNDAGIYDDDDDAKNGWDAYGVMKGIRYVHVNEYRRGTSVSNGMRWVCMFAVENGRFQ